MFASIIRVIKFAFQDFFRNFWLSLVTVTILALALLSIDILIIINALTTHAIYNVKEMVDISVYFKDGISEEQILNVKEYFEKLPQVKAVQYVSKEEALAKFKEKHKDNYKIIESLKELADNPLNATLKIKAQGVSDYPKLLELLQSPQYDTLIESKDFEDYQQLIDKIISVTSKINSSGYVVAVIFVLISILIIFNAIRIAIYTHREEIRAMKLVGATDLFVSSPFLLVGILYTLVALGISMLIIYPFLGFVQPYIANFFEGEVFNIIYYFQNNFVLIFGMQLGVLVVLVLISSRFAIRKYLKV